MSAGRLPGHRGRGAAYRRRLGNPAIRACQFACLQLGPHSRRSLGSVVRSAQHRACDERKNNTARDLASLAQTAPRPASATPSNSSAQDHPTGITLSVFVCPAEREVTPLRGTVVPFVFLSLCIRGNGRRRRENLGRAGGCGAGAAAAFDGRFVLCCGRPGVGQWCGLPVTPGLLGMRTRS